LSIGSDIGLSYAKRKLDKYHNILGTYRSYSESIARLKDKGATLYECDFSNKDSIESAISQIRSSLVSWDNLIVCPGSLKPIGPFTECIFDDWRNSVEVNLIGPLNAIHGLIPAAIDGASVILFAGGGTNGTADDFSAYTMSKIALIKMTELLDSEIKNISFTIIGPGWIKTKIHNETLESADQNIPAYAETLYRLKNNSFGSMDELIDCIEWTLDQSKSVVGGRNISSQQDSWRTDLADKFAVDQSLGKLRRYGNHVLSR